MRGIFLQPSESLATTREGTYAHQPEQNYRET